MLNEKEKDLIKLFQEDRESLKKQLVELSVLPEGFYEKLSQIRKNIFNFTKKLQDDSHSLEDLENMHIMSMQYKVYISGVSLDLKFYKLQTKSVEDNKKLELLSSKKYLNKDTGKISKIGINEELGNELLGLNSFMAFLEDLSYTIKQIDEMLERFSIMVSSQIKTETSQFLHAGKLST